LRIGYGSKTLAIVLALGFVSTALLSWAVVDQAENTLRRDVDDKLKGVLDGKEAELNSWMNAHLDAITVAGFIPTLPSDAQAIVGAAMGGPAAPEARSRVSALMTAITDPTATIDAVLLEAVTGTIVLCTSKQAWEGRGLLNLTQIELALNGPRTLYLPNSTWDQEPRLMAAAPVRDSTLGIVAIMAIVSGSEELSRVLEKPRGLGSTAGIYMVGPDGRLLTNAPGGYGPGDTVRSEGVSIALGGISGAKEYTGSSGNDAIGAYTPVGLLDAALVVEVDYEDALRPMVLIRLAAAAAGTIIAMALIIISFLLTRALTRDLENLVTWSEEIGRGNWEARLELGGTAEAQDMEKAFRQMVRDLQKQQAQLRSAERRYANLFRSSLDPVFTARPDGLITELNASGERVMGIPRQPDGTYGRSLWELFGEESEQKEFASRLDREGAVAGFEARLVLPSGRQLYALLSAMRRYDDAGRLTNLQGVVHDITDRKRFEGALIDAKNQAEFYCDIMSHDLNNAIQGLGGYLELASLARDVDDVNEFLPAAQEQLDRASVLLRNVRRLSRMGSRVVESRPIDVRQVLDRCMKAVTRAHAPTPVRFDVDLPEGAITVMGEEFLDDVFMNLLDNAVKYDKHELKVVQVEADRMEAPDGVRWQFRVKDRGSGIMDRDKKTIFGRFERRALSEYGTGLGLSIVAKAAERCGGRAWVEDRVQGDHTQGACFVIELLEAPAATALVGPVDELSSDIVRAIGPTSMADPQPPGDERPSGEPI